MCRVPPVCPWVTPESHTLSWVALPAFSQADTRLVEDAHVTGSRRTCDLLKAIWQIKCGNEIGAHDWVTSQSMPSSQRGSLVKEAVILIVTSGEMSFVSPGSHFWICYFHELLLQSRTLRSILCHFVALLLCNLCGFLNVVTMND